MTKKELEQFLSRPLTARIATVGEKNNPYIAPMWFLFEDGEILMSTPKTATKIRNIKNNPEVAVTIDVTEGGFNLKGVIFRGRAALDEEKVLETAKRIFKRYIEDVNSPFAKQVLSIPRTIVRITPKHVYSWDYTKMTG
jgi:PPOX class probable F420-dependent enzyme